VRSGASGGIGNRLSYELRLKTKNKTRTFARFGAVDDPSDKATLSDQACAP